MIQVQSRGTEYLLAKSLCSCDMLAVPEIENFLEMIFL